MNIRSTVLRAGKTSWDLTRSAASAIRGERDRPEPWNSGVLDDLADNRPWNLVCKLARAQARLRLNSLEEGVTVLIVNWNTLEVTRDVIDDVLRLSPPSTKVLVIDNASTDGSREYLKTRDDIETMFMSQNVGHPLALDLAMYRVRTTIMVTLDSDAFPLGPDWLEPAVAPVREGRAIISGSRSKRDFVHPMYSAIDVAAFVRRKLSFQLHELPSVETESARYGENIWDAAELIVKRIRPDEAHFVETTPNAAPNLPGMTAGGVVYHHGGVTRATNGSVDKEALQGWKDARVALGVDR